MSDYTTEELNELKDLIKTKRSEFIIKHINNLKSLIRKNIENGRLYGEYEIVHESGDDNSLRAQLMMWMEKQPIFNCIDCAYNSKNQTDIIYFELKS